MPIEWTENYQQFKGLWVALADDERTVLASGRTAKLAHTKARQLGVNIPLLARMPDRLEHYIG